LNNYGNMGLALIMIVMHNLFGNQYYAAIIENAKSYKTNNSKIQFVIYHKKNI